MSADLNVRLSDVMQAERDFNNLTRSSASSDYNDSTMSVRDARKRFERLSSSTSANVNTATAPNYKRSESTHSVGSSSKAAATPARPPPPTKPLRKRATDIGMDTTTTTTTTKNSKGQSAGSAKEDVVDKVATTAGDRNSQDACGESPKPKARSFKPSLKKTQSTMSAADKQASSSGAASSPSSSLSKKLFKKKSVKEDTAAINGRASNKDSPSSSPVPESPVAARRKKHSGSKTSSTSSNQQPSPTHEKASSPKPGKPSLQKSLQKSFSDKVLVHSEGRNVQASLKEDDRGKVVGGQRPTAPRVIEDGELKLNLAEGRPRSL